MTSERNCFIAGTLFPSLPHQIRLSAFNASNRVCDTTQYRPDGGFSTTRPEGQVTAYERFVVLDGSPAERQSDYKSAELFKIVTLEAFRKDFPSTGEHDLIICDEIHKARNVRTASHRVLHSMRCPYFFGLSGTAIEKSLEDLYGILKLLRRKNIEPPIEFLASHIICDSFGKLEYTIHPEFFAIRYSEQMLRRTKIEVDAKIPGINFMEPFLELSSTQEQLAGPILDELEQLKVKLKDRYDLNDFIRRRWLINRIVELSDSSTLVDPETNSSCKLDWLRMILIEECIVNGEKVVVFSRWTRVQQLICSLCSSLGIGWVSLSGADSTEQRQRAIDEFSDYSSDAMVFVSTDAGGVGVNLQNASIIINFEPSWNPSSDAQRIQRVHRLGQQRTVKVYQPRTILDLMFVTITHVKKEFASRRIDTLRRAFTGEVQITWPELLPVINHLQR